MLCCCCDHRCCCCLPRPAAHGVGCLGCVDAGGAGCSTAADLAPEGASGGSQQGPCGGPVNSSVQGVRLLAVAQHHIVEARCSHHNGWQCVQQCVSYDWWLLPDFCKWHSKLAWLPTTERVYAPTFLTDTCLDFYFEAGPTQQHPET